MPSDGPYTYNELSSALLIDVQTLSELWGLPVSQDKHAMILRIMNKQLTPKGRKPEKDIRLTAADLRVIRAAATWRDARIAACKEPIGNAEVWRKLSEAESALSEAVRLQTSAPGLPS